MTFREALIACLTVSASDGLIDKAIIDAGIENVDVQYSKDLKPFVDAAEFELLKVLVSNPDISEGDLSIKQNKEGMKLRLLYLAKVLGKEDELLSIEVVPTISSCRPW